MKLISLYIENFGGLSRYSLDFAAGLTVIEAENGFGKTTLAEFVRAMFYGFPRKGKNLEKNRRQKYMPWNGGRFGGYLIFEYEQIPYRLERFFGASPKGDIFTLTDLSANKKSTRFSENIGLELFGLDSDAFERSTYLPQMTERGDLTTDSIRSKLSNLVEDTNDVGNFEKAMAVLRKRRGSYIPYRGDGGSVMQAHSRISQLQEQLHEAEKVIPELAGCEEAVRQLENRSKQLQTEWEQTRRDLRLATEISVIQALRRRDHEMVLQLQEKNRNLESLERKYPGGIPEMQKIEEARQMAAGQTALKGREVTNPEDLEAEAFLEANRLRFASGVPDREALDLCRDRCRAYFAAVAEARSKGLSDSEKEQYRVLKSFYDAGKLDEARLEKLAAAHRELTEKEHRLSNLELPGGDVRALAALEAYFAAGIPSEETLKIRQEELEQLRQLRKENARLTEETARLPKVKKSPLQLILFLLLTAAAAAGGTVMLLRQEFLWAGIALGIGVLGITGAVFAGRRLMQARKLAGAVLAEQETVRQNREKIAALKHSLESFTRLYTDNDMMGTALYEIQDKRSDCLALRKKQEQMELMRRNLEQEIQNLKEKLIRELGTDDFERHILNLHLAREQFRELQQKLRQRDSEGTELLEQAEAIRKEIVNFLSAYGCAESDDLHSVLSELERSSDTYRRASRRVEKWREEKRRNRQEAERYIRYLEAFFRSAGVTMEADPENQLLGMRDDRKDWEEASGDIRHLCAELKQFRAEHAQQLGQSLPDLTEDPEQLRDREIRLQRALTACTDELLLKKLERRQLKDRAGQIPPLRDDLQMWQEKMHDDREKAAILDDTMAFLEQAKENLAVSYLGPIRHSFNGYMEKLWGKPETQLMVTQELDVLLERYGQSRELGYFSAGESDLVMLCMRFALVDALFGKESPCVILDDPFVNLDDAHTKQALELLAELARSRQILYLTCSTSRIPN